MQTGLRGRDLIALSDWTNEEIETAIDVGFELKRKRALGERRVVGDAPDTRGRAVQTGGYHGGSLPADTLARAYRGRTSSGVCK